MENNNNNSNSENISDSSIQTFQTIEKYLQLITLEFKEHITKYRTLYTNVKNYIYYTDLLRIKRPFCPF